MIDTRERLMTAAFATICDDGLAAASARTIAGRADANQALIFYHFHSVSELIEAAAGAAVERSVEHYRESFAAAASFADLLTIAGEIHQRERALGNVTFMAQLLAGARHDPVLARAAAHGVQVWTNELKVVLRRVMADHPLSTLVEVDGLAHAIAAGFLGLELYDGVDPTGAASAFGALEGLGKLVQVFDDLGPVATRALKARIRATRRRKDLR